MLAGTSHASTWALVTGCWMSHAPFPPWSSHWEPVRPLFDSSLLPIPARSEARRHLHPETNYKEPYSLKRPIKSQVSVTCETDVTLLPDKILLYVRHMNDQSVFDLLWLKTIRENLNLTDLCVRWRHKYRLTRVTIRSAPSFSFTSFCVHLYNLKNDINKLRYRFLVIDLFYSIIRCYFCYFLVILKGTLNKYSFKCHSIGFMKTFSQSLALEIETAIETSTLLVPSSDIWKRYNLIWSLSDGRITVIMRLRIMSQVFWLLKMYKRRK